MKKPIYKHGKLHFSADVPSRDAPGLAWAAFTLLVCIRDPQSLISMQSPWLSWIFLIFLPSLLSLAATPCGATQAHMHVGVPPRWGSTWTDGWMDGMDGQPSSWMLSPAKLMGSSGLSKRGNIGKLLFSSFIFKRREIFECYRGAIAMARLTNSVG